MESRKSVTADQVKTPKDSGATFTPPPPPPAPAQQPPLKMGIGPTKYVVQPGRKTYGSGSCVDRYSGRDQEDSIE
ncbi:hypothetical protein SAMD00023353_8000400 [Rosellinia necatrix]|uniref:Uncharacterized protein n=1 Tax=Rosellinia necatrix TaxID=77044 RepID=A0A1S8AAP7_ROSNE|nr:hypothetical protein SAMD00023353_8000400 [Rosellinia necatrix]